MKIQIAYKVIYMKNLDILLLLLLLRFIFKSTLKLSGFKQLIFFTFSYL